MNFFADNLKLPKVAIDRWILHADLDSFYASVEQKLHPELKGKPVIVGPNPKLGQSRGVVLTCSYEARKFGVRSAMPINQANKLCPDAYYSFSGFNAYNHESKAVIEIFKEFCSEISQVSIDEAFLDLSQSFKDSTSEEVTNYCKKIQREVLNKTELDVSIGGSHTKAIAKIASQLAKPRGVLVIEESKFRDILDPLPLDIISGVGKKSTIYLNQLGFEKIGDIANIPYQKLQKNLQWIWLTVHGIIIPKEPENSSRSHSKERTFNEDVSDHIILRKTVRKLLTSLLDKLEDEYFKTMTIKVRNKYFGTFTRSKSFPNYINSNDELTKKKLLIIANELLNEFLIDDQEFRLIGVKISNFKENKLIQSNLSKYF